jgi:hypothetical protein
MARRYDNWFAPLVFWPGVVVKDGPIGAELVRSALAGEEPGAVNIDVIGIGSSEYDSLKTMYKTNPINVSEGSNYRDRSGKLKMRNKRAEMYWRFRDALDPKLGDDIALPPGNEIVADLCSARYTSTTAGVQIEEKEQIKARLGRSPDKGESILLAHFPVSRGVFVG